MISVVLYSINFPNRKKPVPSATRAACCMLWVTITMVHWSFKVNSKSSILAVAMGSSAEQGSSSRSTSGSTARARAMQRRCCCPDPRRLLHVMSHDHDGALVFQSEQQIFDLGGSDGIERRDRRFAVH